MSGEIEDFHRQQIHGALRNGTRIQKIRSKPDEPHQDGAPGTVLGSVGPFTRKEVEDGLDADSVPMPKDLDVAYGYFIEWDDMPGMAVFIVSWRITA